MVDNTPPPIPQAARALHIGSAVLARDPVGSRIEAAAADAPFVTIDYNVRVPSIVDRRAYCERLRRIARVSGVVKASSVDIALLGEGDPEAYMMERVREGAAMAVLTCAEDGAHAFTANARAHAPSRADEIVDPVGAGDSFMAALLCRLQAQNALSPEVILEFGPRELTALLDYAQRAAAFTCAQKGVAMPTRAELMEPFQ